MSSKGEEQDDRRRGNEAVASGAAPLQEAQKRELRVHVEVHTSLEAAVLEVPKEEEEDLDRQGSFAASSSRASFTNKALDNLPEISENLQLTLTVPRNVTIDNVKKLVLVLAPTVFSNVGRVTVLDTKTDMELSDDDALDASCEELKIRILSGASNSKHVYSTIAARQSSHVTDRGEADTDSRCSGGPGSSLATEDTTSKRSSQLSFLADVHSIAGRPATRSDAHSIMSNAPSNPGTDLGQGGDDRACSAAATAGSIAGNTDVHPPSTTDDFEDDLYDNGIPSSTSGCSVNPTLRAPPVTSAQIAPSLFPLPASGESDAPRAANISLADLFASMFGSAPAGAASGAMRQNPSSGTLTGTPPGTRPTGAGGGSYPAAADVPLPPSFPQLPPQMVGAAGASPFAQMLGAASASGAKGPGEAPTAGATDPFAAAGINQMMEQMMSSPEVMRRLMESPLMRQMTDRLMENPEMLRRALDSHPQIRQLRERNPELNAIFNDSQFIKEVLEGARKPGLMREIIGNMDRAMSRVDSIPGGFNAIRRMYQSIQEPMWEAAFGDGRSKDQVYHEYELNTDKPPNSEALPNPWASRESSASAPVSRRELARGSPSSGDTVTPGISRGIRESVANPPAAPEASGTVRTTPQFGADEAVTIPEGSLQAAMGQTASTGVRSMAPIMPGRHPQEGSQSRHSAAVPLQHPENQGVPTSVSQIAESSRGASASTQPSSSPTLLGSGDSEELEQYSSTVLRSQSDPYSQATSTATAGSSERAVSVEPNSLLSQMLGSMLDSNAGRNVTGLTRGNLRPPAGLASLMQAFLRPQAYLPQTAANASDLSDTQRYAHQIESLRHMGFSDVPTVLDALRATDGNINRALDRLLSMGDPSNGGSVRAPPPSEGNSQPDEPSAAP